MKTTKVSNWVTQHRFSRAVASLLFSTVLLTGTAYAAGLINQDTGVHAPPITGSSTTFDYNLFKPSAPGFPAVGGTYTDPVFGSVVRRLTNQTGNPNCDNIYAHHWANANGTLAFAGRIVGGFCREPQIVNVTTGVEVFSNQPSGLNGSEMYWDALDPDKYYYFSGADLVRRNLTAQTSTTRKTFPAPLQANGGSVNIQSRDGRYFTVRYGGTNKVWDSQTGTIYSGSVTPVSTGGWIKMTADGKYLINAASGALGFNHYSHAIDHNAQSVSSTGVLFWNLCGDHGDTVSASDGKTYYITNECYDVGGQWRVDVSRNVAGYTNQQVRDANRRLINSGFSYATHFSGVSRGAFQDWSFISTEYGPDDWDGTGSPWVAYAQEILAVNVLTFEVRRLAHHRSRHLSQPDTNYAHYPRVSSSWDGSAVMWASNYNTRSPVGYADLYAIQFPLGARIAAPQNLRFK